MIWLLSSPYSSLWAYLVHEHGMEESTAERRIRAARLMRRFPSIAEPLKSGRLTLSLLEIAQSVLSREKLSDDEFLALLGNIEGMSCKKARREVASIYPQSIETLRDQIRPLTGELSEVRFMATQELLDKLDEIRGLLAHSHPGASLCELIDVLATEYRTRHHPEEKAKKARSGVNDLSPSLTKVPSQPIVHALVLRDGYRCSYQDPKTAKRCNSTYGLQIDHIQSWSTGGTTELKNLRYLCGSHHRRVSFLEFGESQKYFSK